MLGLTGTNGVPCTETASGTSWFQYYDDSQSSASPWNLAYPTDWKWTRIQLKGNNSTPVPVNGNASDSSQACWNGRTQMSTPTGYSVGCQPTGGVTAVTVTTSGSGYTSAPTVGFVGGGGTGATATAVLAAEMTGYISAVTVTSSGVGYSSAPSVTFSSGGATAVAVLSSSGSTVVTGGSVTSATVTAAGTGYTSAPTVSFSGADGSGATAVATLSSSGTTVTTGYVNTPITVTNGGSGYTSAPTVALTGGGGSGATATATLGTSGTIKSVTLNTQGTHCFSQASDAVITFSGTGGATASAVLEPSRSCVYSLNVSGLPNCTNKLIAPTYSPIDQKSGVTLTTGNLSFSGTLFVTPANDKTPSSMTVQTPGYDPVNYVGAPSGVVTSTLRLASGAWADCGNINVPATMGYRIASITVTNAGSGYAADPTITITGGTGTGANATATAVRGFPVVSVTRTAQGSSYSSAPTVSFSGGGGSSAAATATVTTSATTTYGVASITITSGGTGYTSAPSVTLSGGSGSGAAATAGITTVNVTTYPVASITVTSGGTGYSTGSPPTITLNGGGGSGAGATATVSTVASGSFAVDHINVTASGTGYTSNPSVTLTGGLGVGGTAGTAASQVSGGTNFGKVWLLTSLAVTRTGARTMLQMEVASPVLGFALGGALTLDGPNPVIDAMPNSNNFRIEGDDDNSCHETAEADHPAIDGYDDPNANPATASVETIVDALPRPDHYTGAGGTPSVQNGYAALGETMTTPDGLSSVIGAIYNAPGAHHYTTATVGTFSASSTTNSSITYVDGDLTLSGNQTGRGILVVTGTLHMSGNFSWYGLIFVVGDGQVEFNGGGNGEMAGSIFVAKIWDNNTNKNLLNSMGSPTFHWNGGGGNGIRYDHCYASNLMTAVPTLNLHSTRVLKVLSFRYLSY